MEKKFSKRLTGTIVILLTVLGFVIRVWKTDTVPAGFHRDEAALGYNAYSILKTGRDMSGNPFPLHLSSFLYSPALYSYLAIPSIAVFSLTPFAVRLPSIVFGTLTIPLLFFLCRKLVQKEKYRDSTALLAAGWLSVNPWHIVLSRTATEHVPAVCFFLVSLLLFFSYVQQKKNHLWFLAAAYAGFLIMMGLYQAPRAFLPIMVPLLLFLYWNDVDKKGRMGSVLLSILCVLLPLFAILRSPELSTRMNMLSVFSSKETTLVIEEQIKEDGNMPLFVSRMFHNKLIGYTREIGRNYMQHFSYDFFFTDSVLPKRYSVIGTGILYGLDMLFLAIGLYVCLRKRTRMDIVLLGWILIAPIGSSVAFDDIPNMQRTLIMTPALAILWARGLVFVSTSRIMRYHSFLRRSIAVSLFGLFIFSVIRFSHQYFVHGNIHHPRYRQEGYQELVRAVQKLLPEFRHVFVSDSESAPTIFFLFFSSYDPLLFQNQTKGESAVTFDKTDFGPYTFSEEPCPLRWETVLDEKTNELVPHYTGNPYDLFVNLGDCAVPKEAVVMDRIKRLDGSTVFQVLRSTK